MSPRPKLVTPLGNLKEAIITTAWQQIAAFGAAALSLRAIARELKVSAPSIYNYYANRDALVTALIVEGFTSFGDALQAAVAACPEEDHAGRFRAIGLAYRQWAVTYPERYQLIFGTPIAGYSAPMELTDPAASRALSYLIAVLASAEASGCLRLQNIPAMAPQMEAMLTNWQTGPAPRVTSETLYLAITIWGHVHGLVSLEIGNQYPPFITDAGQIYLREIERIGLEIMLP
jgi:AcrR family transcriptional regulator